MTMMRTDPQAPRENKLHGDSMFPLAEYVYTANPGEQAIDCHWHEEAEFVYVLKGQTLFQIGTRYFPVKAGEAVFVHSGDIHAGHPYGDSGCEFFAVVFHMDWLQSMAHDRVQNDYLSPLLAGKRSLPQLYDGKELWSASILDNLNAIRRVLESKLPGYELAVKARIYLILAEIAGSQRWVQRRRGKEVERNQTEALKKVLSYIEANYRDKIYIKQLAEMTHMSESQFCRFFKRLVRKTPVEYMNGYRIRRAAALLREGDRKMLDIAMEVGFDNPSYFIKRFREELRCTPAEYRKLHLQGEAQD